MSATPTKLMDRIIHASSDPGDVIWEPFAGLAGALVIALRQGRRGFGADINPQFYRYAGERLRMESQGDLLDVIYYPEQAG